MNSARGEIGRLLNSGGFSFSRLTISGINNEPLLALNDPGQREEEICLFHSSVATGDKYLNLLADRIESAISNGLALPVVRFADGEYAFYSLTLKCNGLYNQAESTEVIRSVLPLHIRALHQLLAGGIIAPLIFPGNVRPRRGFRAIFGKKDGRDLAFRFLEFMSKNGMGLTAENYVPFYAVYAYLSSPQFAATVDGKRLCVVNADFNEDACVSWFERTGSRPRIVHVPIPDSYVATRWHSMREEVFASITEKPDLFMVGAGVGALQICVEASCRFSVPAIDSGHIINMMNRLEKKSAGPRLFTFNR